MRRGLIPRDSVWIDSLYRARSAAAAALDSAGEAYPAYLAYRDVRSDFAVLHDVAADSARGVTLAASKPVRRVLEHRADIAARHRAYLETLQHFIARARRESESPRLSPSLKELEIARLQRQAADTSDRYAALGAAQLLEQVFVVTAFYEPREALASGHPERALALLEIADAIHPGAPFVCASRREALRKLGRTAEAAALRCSSD